MLPLSLFLPFAFGYFLSYLFRVVNAVAGPALGTEIGLDAGGLGFLTSVYFLTFGAFQLPLGVLLDRFGPRRVEATLLMIAGIGAVLFGLAESLVALSIGRGLIGLGVSACLMGAFKAYSMTVPAQKLPLVNGLHLAAGGLGALVGGAPSEFFLGIAGWRALFFGLGGLSFVAAALLLLLVPEMRRSGEGTSLARQFSSIGKIATDPVFIRIAPFCLASQGTAIAILSLWSGPWLRDVAGLAPADAAWMLSLMAVSMTAGFICLGTLASRFEARGFPTLYFAMTGMVTYVVVQVLVVLLPPRVGLYTWLIYSFFSTSGILLYPVLTAAFAPEYSGRVNTAINFLVFAFSFAVQWAVGEIVDAFAGSGGTTFAYQVAFSITIAIQIVAAIWLFLGIDKARSPVKQN